MALEQLGWQVRKDVIQRSTSHHEPLGFSSSNQTHFDVHRFIVPQNIFMTRKQQLTKVAWELAQQDWEDVSLFTLPDDLAALFGIILARTWTGDNWRLKPHDYLDLELFRDHNLSLELLMDRARILRLEGATRLFLARCNPWQQHLTLVPPSRTQRMYYQLSTVRERQLFFNKLRKVPDLIHFATQEFRHVMWALNHYHRLEHVEIQATQSKGETEKISTQTLNHISYGIKWITLRVLACDIPKFSLDVDQ